MTRFLKRPCQGLESLLRQLPSHPFPEKADHTNVKGFYGADKLDGYMSNFARYGAQVPTANFNIEGLKEQFGDTLNFVNSEQMFMFFKGVTFFDRNTKTNFKILCKIMTSIKPTEIKALGRKLDCSSEDGSFDEVVWKKERCLCMYDAVYYKFTQNENLTKWLKKTQNMFLVECTQNDRNWGSGIPLYVNCKYSVSNKVITVEKINPDLYDPSKWTGVNRYGYSWVGTNLLGEVLMVLREQLDK